MNRIVQFNTDENHDLLIEVKDNDEYYEDTFVSGGREINKASIKFIDSLSSIKTVAKAAADHILALPQKPSEFSIEFGLKISGNTNAIIASGSAEGNLKVTITWSDKEGKTKDQ